MKRNRSPEALAQEWLTAMDAYLAKAVKPGIVVVMIPRDKAAPELAKLIRRIREQDARLCNRIGLDGGDTHTAHVAVLCRDAIRAQNTKRARGCVSCSPRCARLER